MSKRGFTLIELLAVIVILSIILAIAVPGISNIMKNSAKSAFESDAKMVLKAADYKKLDDPSFKESLVNQDNVNELLGLSNDNYSSLKIVIGDNIPIITIVGKSKWNGLVACGSYKNIRVVENESDCGTDLVPPVITLNGSSTVNINEGETYSDMGATATDNIDGNITANVVTTGSINTLIPGTYTITYTITDSGGNTSTITRTVIVVDNVAPTVTFNPDGDNNYAKTSTTTVTVNDAGTVNTDSLKYVWTTSNTEPVEDNFSNAFINGDIITSPVGVTGTYYLWVIALDTFSNKTIIRSNAFNLDNTAPVITLNGSSSVNINIGDIYSDAGATAIDNIDGTVNVTSTGTVDPSVPGAYTITYNATDSSGNTATSITRTVNVVENFSGPGYIASKGVNGPVLATGMTPIKWNGTAWINATINDPDWYNYTTTDKKWANAKTADGSMWVWIPRYAYQITTGYHTSTAGTIVIKFLKGDTNTASDSTQIYEDNASNTHYVKHPAFDFGTTKLTGIWVSKFEVSGTITSLNSKPGVSSLRSITVGSMFTASRNMETNNKYGWTLASTLNTNGTFTTDNNNVDSHMMKNLEWGAVAYLSKSTYGKNAEITINSDTNYYTGGGAGNAYVTNVGQSTTGNIYGIYDMSGGAYEYVMSNHGNAAGNSGLTPSNINYKYIDRYTAYDSTKYGDAEYETSAAGTGGNSWYGDASLMSDTSYPWLQRSGKYSDGVGAGIFRFSRYDGSADSGYSFRLVLAASAGL